MSVLIAIALKSLLIAGLTLGVLALMKQRSAAERSWVAHIGLLALVIMALTPLALPSWNVEAPALFGKAPAVQPQTAAPLPKASATITHVSAPTVPATATPARHAVPTISTGAAASAIYAIPAALLLLVTMLALVRLIALQARAEVLVDGHWLTALARAQRRMGFKHGTALLTSNALASPISWGLMRPVILLNSRAVEASEEAEAIIAHELAHVARMDWVKLLLARIATALFWFNPLVWMLAREAHQLREEAADDAVLGADIPDTDYAQLLVGVARHECPGLLLGAHGVAPSKSSLARRVARVLDGKSIRGPVGGSFAAGVFVGAVMIAAPLAALTLTPAGSAQSKLRNSGATGDYSGSAYYPGNRAVPVDLPHIIARGVSTSVAAATAAVTAEGGDSDFEAIAPSGAKVASKNGVIVATAPNGQIVTSKPNGRMHMVGPSGGIIDIYPPDSNGHRRAVLTGPSGSVVEYADAGAVPGLAAAIGAPPAPPMPPVPPRASRAQHDAIELAIQLKAVGVTPEYAAAMKASLPQLRLTSEDLVQLKAVGVTPEFIQELAREGYRGLNADDIVGAYAVGVRPDYIRAMAASGYPRLSLDQLTQLRAVGVMRSDVERFRRAGFTHLDVDELVEAKSLGLTPEEIRASRDDP